MVVQKGEIRMARKILVVIAALIIMISGILLWQWRLYDQKNTTNKSASTKVNQYIIVETQSDSLNITQIFKGLQSKEEYTLVAPAAVSDWYCIGETGGPCPSNDQNPYTFQPEKGELKIRFSIPFQNGSNHLMLTNWLLKIQKAEMESTKVEITDSTLRKGTWVAGIPLKGYQKLVNIDYYLFEGLEDNPTLYWQQTPLYMNETNDFYSYYSENPNENIERVFTDKDLFKGPTYITIIHSNENSIANLPDMVITADDFSAEKIQKAWLFRYFTQKFQIKSTEKQWIVDVFISLYLNQQGETPKGTYMIEQLSAQLDLSERQQLVKQVMQNSKADPIVLDKILGEIKGMRTQFFSRNKELQQENYSLSFYDRRAIKMNGEWVNNYSLLNNNNELFFPFIQTVKLLGFHVEKEQNNDSILLENNKDQYVFNSNGNLFIHNNQKYGLLENPFITHDGVLFINQRGLQTLFHVAILKTEKEIFIKEP